MFLRKLQPSGDHILIQFAGESQPAPAVKPSTRRRKIPSAAKVIAVGPGHANADGKLVPLGLKVGERIYVERGRGIKIRLHRQDYAVIRKRDLVPPAKSR